jgi:hypothetical protein
MANDKFRRGYDVQTLVDILAKVPIGGTLSVEELADQLRLDKNSGKFRAALASARRIVQTEGRIVIACEHGTLTRLDDGGIVQVATGAIQRIRRASVRSLKKLGCADYDKLDNAAKAKHDAAASHLGILAECARPSIVARIEDVAARKAAKLTFDETIKAFRE